MGHRHWILAVIVWCGFQTGLVATSYGSGEFDVSEKELEAAIAILEKYSKKGRQEVKLSVKDGRVHRQEIEALPERLPQPSQPFIDDQRSGKSPCLSADGRKLAYMKYVGPKYEIRFVDLVSGTDKKISSGPGGREFTSCRQPSVSADGNLVAFNAWFESNAKGVYLHRVSEGRTILVEEAAHSPEISGDGSTIVFVRDPGHSATRPGGVAIYDVATGRTTWISKDTRGIFWNAKPRIDGSGRYVVFKRDVANSNYTWSHSEIILHDCRTRTTTEIGRVATKGKSFKPRISADGSTVVVENYDDPQRPALRVYETATGRTRLIQNAFHAELSHNGRRLTALGVHSSGVIGAFLHDLSRGTVTEVARATQQRPRISATLSDNGRVATACLQEWELYTRSFPAD